MNASLVDEFSDLMQRARLSKDSFIASTLASEVEYLRDLPPNGPKARLLLRALGRLQADRKRLSITLDKRLAKEISQVCDEKGITRDQFIGAYVSFLVHGDPDTGDPSPLEKALAILSDPRFGYATINGSNPYQDLHMSEEDVDWLKENVGSRAKE